MVVSMVDLQLAAPSVFVSDDARVDNLVPTTALWWVALKAASMVGEWDVVAAARMDKLWAGGTVCR